jgi:NADH dehydrogenase
VRLSGFLGWLVWLVVHITFLTGFKNRFAALLNWGITFLGGGRAERTITVRQTVGRVALADAGADADGLSEHLIAPSRPGRGERA